VSSSKAIILHINNQTLPSLSIVFVNIVFYDFADSNVASRLDTAFHSQASLSEVFMPNHCLSQLVFPMYTHYVKQELILGAEFLNLLHLAFHHPVCHQRDREREYSRQSERRLLL
jgi:hypothetical protein